jgi:glycine hydroxymethyltransferase
MTTHKMLRGPRGAIILSREEASAKAIDKAVFPGLQGGPHDHVTAGMAVALHEALQPGYKGYCQQVIDNAQALAEALMSRGISVVTGGTDNHLVLADLSVKDVPGKIAQQALDRANITTNANMVPGDKRSAFDPSGLRMGSPAATTRGFKQAEMKQVGNWIADVVEHVDDEKVIERVQGEVMELCGRLPLWY